VKDSNLQPWD